MANEYLDIATRLERKLSSLLEARQHDAAQIARLEERVVVLQDLLTQSNSRVTELNMRLNSMRAAGVLATNDEERRATRTQIDRMVRDIDKCLELLSV